MTKSQDLPIWGYACVIGGLFAATIIFRGTPVGNDLSGKLLVIAEYLGFSLAPVILGAGLAFVVWGVNKLRGKQYYTFRRDAALAAVILFLFMLMGG